MTEILQFSYNNNTLDLESIEKTIVEIKQNSFHYLYKLQLDLAGYKRFNFKMSDLKLINNINKSRSYYPKKYVAFVNENFISDINKVLYRRSLFFNKELTIFDISNNPKIFTKTFMVFINGKLFDTINILCKEDTTYIIFDIYSNNNQTGIPYEYFNELMSIDADISVIFIANCEYGIYNTNINVLKKYSNQLSLDRFNIVNNLDTESNYITFINDNSLLFPSVITDTENSEGLLKFFNNTFNDFQSKIIHINIFGFRHLFDQIDLVGTEKYFQIPIQDMPIPIENIMIFKNIDGKKYFAHDIQLKLYYPNIYEVINNINNDNLTFYIFYSNDTFSVVEKYQNDLELYYQYTSNILDKYKDSTILEIIKTYTPPEYIYDIKDYVESNLEHVDYKIKTLKDWVKLNSKLLDSYFTRQVLEYGGYYIDVSKIDLESRYRIDNYSEIIDENLQETFSEPRYVFIFKNEFNSQFFNLRFFIDGKLYIPDKFYKTQKFEYYYIPTTLITENSLIEIEKMDNLYIELPLNINSLDEFILLENSDSSEISINDVFIIDNDLLTFIDRTLFSVFVKDENNEYIELLDNNTFVSDKQLFIKLKDIDLLTKNLTLYVIKKSKIYEWEILTEQDENNNNYFIIENENLINDIRQFRIYKNGYFLPSSLYIIKFIDFNTITINFTMKKNIGDKFIIETTPYKYKLIHNQSTINNNGYIDLNGLICRPLNLKWYDLYLNGIKLNRNNIHILSPTKMIIKNVQTIKNFIIIEKNRDDEFISLKDCVPTIIDTLLTTNGEFINNITSQNSDIIDSLPDILSDVFTLFDMELLNFYTNILSQMLINPDLEQIIDEFRNEFPNVFIESDFIIKPDLETNPDNILEINPDK